jgi:hypothetical protein
MAMAQDGYRSMPDHQAFNPYPEPQHSQPTLRPASAYAPMHYSESERQRYREASPGQRSKLDSAQYQRTRQPINDAVNSAVNKAEASNALPPEVLSQIASQITASVLQQLKATNSDSPVPFPVSGTPTPIPAPTNGTTSSSSVQPDNSPPLFHHNIYTPPSPHRPVDEAVLASPTSPTKSTYSFHGRISPDDDRRPTSPTSQIGQHDEVHSDRSERPKAPVRKSTEITTLEKIWGPLFDGNRATARLSQFLRGLALHLIEDYEPKCSLVITPAKMQKYYDDTKLTTELYPWQMVFDDRTSSISRLYREVEAQHHLVQDRLDERPDIPGLTPIGFERWGTLMLLAHPEQEFERLQKAVLDMPICNFDDRKERFPKEISRRLFPKISDQISREKVERAVVTHCNINLQTRWASGSEPIPQQPQPTAIPKRADSMASTTSSAPLHPGPETASTAATQGTNAERERQPYSNAPSEDAIDEEELPTPQPIERERKPYTAQPGGGKNFDDINRPPTPPESRNAGPPPVSVSAQSAKLGRSSSVASGSARPGEPQRTQPISVNTSQYPRQSVQSGMEGLSISESAPPIRNRANSLLNHHHPSGRAMRHRSPSANTKGGEYHRTDSDILFAPTSYGPYSTSPSGEVMEDARRQREFERHYPPDRPEPMRSSMYETSARDREPRPRYQSNAGHGDASRNHYSSDEDYYRSAGGRSHNGYDGQQYYR